MRPIVPILTTIVAIAGTGIGVLTNYSSQTPSISSIVETNKKNWHGKFDSIKEKLASKGVDVPEWSEASWKKWVTRFDNLVPEEFKRSIVDDIWMPVIGETIVSQTDNISLNSLVSEVMSGRIQEGGEEYNKLIEEVNKEKAKNAANPRNVQNNVQREVNENPLDERRKKEVYEKVLKSYKESKNQFKKTREEWRQKGKENIPDWNEEAWKKSVAIFYMSIPDNKPNEYGAIDGLWRSVVQEAFAKEKNSANEIEFVNMMTKNSGQNTKKAK